MDDGGRCCLSDVINDPHLLESFLGTSDGNPSNGNKNDNNSSSNSQQSTGKPTQSSNNHKVNKKSAKVTRGKVTANSSADGKSGRRKVEARQVDTVTSSDACPAATDAKEGKKNSRNKSYNLPSQTAVPNNSLASGLMLPQPMIQMGPSGQLQQMVPSIGGQMILARPPNQAAGSLVQIIQSPHGPTAQLISVPVQQAGHQTSKAGSGQGARAANKQILPKPSSSPSSTPVSSLTVAGGGQNPVIRSAVAGTLTSNNVNAAGPQLILGGQSPSFIQGPNGTLILNPSAFSSIGGQPFIFPNNGLPGQIQFTIRPSTPVVSSSPSFQANNTPLLNALSNPVAPSSTRPSAGQPTYVLQSPVKSQTILAPRSSQNMLLTRNTAPLFSSPTIMQNQAAPQFIQIQTANGPMLLPLSALQGLASSPQILSQASQPVAVPNNNTLVHNFGGGGTTLQSLLSGNGPANDLSHISTSVSSHSLIITSPSVQTSATPAARGASGKKGNTARSVNLEDLLKESGILENSPPSSPIETRAETSTTSADFAQHTHMLQHPPQSPHQTVFVVPTGANQTPHNLVLTQSGLQNSGLNQLRLALTADGTMILQPSGPNVSSFGVQQPVSVSHVDAAKVPDVAKDLVLGVSQPSPDSTTPTLDANPQSVRVSTADQSVESKDIAQHSFTAEVASTENAGRSQIAKKDHSDVLLSKNDASSNSSTPSSVMIRTANCDNLSQADAVVRRNESAGVQISVNDKAFLEGLELQIKSLSSLTTATAQQKIQLQELVNIQNQINEAKKNQSSGLSGEGVKTLLSVPPVRMPSQESQSAFQSATRVIQTNTHGNVSLQPQQQQQQQQQNLQIVNLLKPGISVTPGSQTSIRLVSATGAATTSEAPTFQLMGNQYITIASPAKSQTQTVPSCTAPVSKVSLDNTPVLQVVRLQSTSASVITPTPILLAPTSSVTDPIQDQERKKQKTIKLFSEQLVADQMSALKPDYKTPFKSLEDAGKRLLRYHVLQSPATCTPDVLNDIDEKFEIISRNLLIKKQLLLDRFRRCLLQQSYRSETSESVMLNRLFIADETSAIKFDKEVVAQGIPLDLPPPPRSWLNEINARVDEEREMNRKRKLPLLDEDLSEHLSAVKKPVPEPVLENNSEEETEDEDEDSDDDDDEDGNQADDMSEYLGPNDHGSEDINSIIDEINYDTGLNPVDSRPVVDLNYCERAEGMAFGSLPQQQQQSHSEWRMSFHRSTLSADVWHTTARFPEREAAVAVESILTSEEEENGLAVPGLSGMVSQSNVLDDDEDDDDEEEEEEEEDGEEEDEEEDGDEDEDEVSEEVGLSVSGHSYPHSYPNDGGLQQDQPQQQQQSAISCDPQVQCAIDSILVDLPQQQQQTHQPFFNVDNYSRSYGSMSGNMSVGHRTSMASFGHSLQGQINDPALDEAVKSILS